MTLWRFKYILGITKLSFAVSNGDGEEQQSDESISTDYSNLVSVHNNITVECELDVLLDEVYQVPCPYLRLWRRSTGELLSLEEATILITGAVISLSDDHSVYHFGTLMPVIHPVTGRSSLSLHCCDFARRLQPLMETMITETCEVDSKEAAIRNKEQYLVAWLSHVGSHLGLHFLSPSLYKEWNERLKNGS